MTIDEKNKVDLITVDKAGMVILIMISRLPWDEKGDRLLALQEKIKRYLAYFQEGQLFIDFPTIPKNSKFALRLDYAFAPSAPVRDLINLICEKWLIPEQVVWQEGLIK